MALGNQPPAWKGGKRPPGSKALNPGLNKAWGPREIRPKNRENGFFQIEGPTPWEGPHNAKGV